MPKQLTILKHLNKACDVLQDDLNESKVNKDMDYYHVVMAVLKSMKLARELLQASIVERPKDLNG